MDARPDRAQRDPQCPRDLLVREVSPREEQQRLSVTGVERDPIQAAEWLARSDAQKEVAATKYLEDMVLTRRLTSEELREGKRRATEKP